MFFFCKQKTAYEMRISDWSSDVCSSDLNARLAIGAGVIEELHKHDIAVFRAGPGTFERRFDGLAIGLDHVANLPFLQAFHRFRNDFGMRQQIVADHCRSEERRVGKEGVSTFRSRWSPYH